MAALLHARADDTLALVKFKFESTNFDPLFSAVTSAVKINTVVSDPYQNLMYFNAITAQQDYFWLLVNHDGLTTTEYNFRTTDDTFDTAQLMI